MRSSLFLDVRQRRLVSTDISRQHFGPIFKIQAVQKDSERVTFEAGASRLSRNVSTLQSSLPNISEKRRSHLKVQVSKKWIRHENSTSQGQVAVSSAFVLMSLYHNPADDYAVVPFYWRTYCIGSSGRCSLCVKTHAIWRITMTRRTNLLVYQHLCCLSELSCWYRRRVENNDKWYGTVKFHF
jgi:hypothetical protein